MKHQLSLLGIAALLAALSGCPFRKQPPPVPQQGQAPTVQPEPAPPPPADPPVETQPAPPPAEPQKTETTAEKTPPKKKPSAKKPAAPASTNQGQQTQAAPAAPASAPTQTSKLVIQEGSAPNSQGQLAAGVALEDSSSRNKQTTEQLLQSTDANLKSINRPLSPEEQAMVAQIKEYMKQSREATASSEGARAQSGAQSAIALRRTGQALAAARVRAGLRLTWPHLGLYS